MLTTDTTDAVWDTTDMDTGPMDTPTDTDTTARGPLMPSLRLMLMLTTDTADTPTATGPTDTVTDTPTDTDTTERGPLMLRPRLSPSSLATPVSSEVSTP